MVTHINSDVVCGLYVLQIGVSLEPISILFGYGGGVEFIRR